MMAVMAIALHTEVAEAQNYVKESYCPKTKGLELKYTNLDKEGKVVGTYISEMTACEGSQKKGVFAFDQHFFKENGEPLLKDNNLRMDVVISGNGPTESKMSGLNRVMKAQNLMTKGDVSTIPAILEVGMTLPDSEIRLSIDNISAKLFTRERVVADHKTITTPAGSFDCYLLKEVQMMKTVGTQTEKLETWYAKGIGAVKQSFYNKKGELVRSMELVSLKVKP